MSELFPANNSRMYQNCQNNSAIISVPELLIQAILGGTRIVQEFFTCRLNGAIGHILCGREIHPLDPQPHWHFKLASGICASGYAVLPGEVLVT